MSAPVVTIDRAHLPAQLIAAMTVASMLLPQAVAHAAIAGVSSAHAMLAALFGLGVYALLGSSRFAVVSATSSSAAIFASAVATNGVAGAFTLVWLTGLLFVLAALFKADFLATFIARPVLRGFSYALALSIGVRQIAPMTGLVVSAGNLPQLVLRLLQNLSHVHLPSLMLGGGTWALWLFLRHLYRKHPWVQPPLLVLVAGALATALLPLQALGVAHIGTVDMSRLGLALPQLEWADWVLAAHVAPALFMVLFAESWGTARTLALRHGETVRARQEMLALGVANVACGLFQGLPVGAGYSASTANEAAGGHSRWVGAGCAVLMALTIWLLRDALALLPMPVMAAMVVGILTDSLTPRPLLESLKLGGDAWLGVVTLVGVLLMGVMMGMLLSVGLSVLLALRRFSLPLLSELGRLPGSHDFLDMARHPEVYRLPGVLIMRPEEPVFFANAEAIFQHVRRRAVSTDLRAVVLSLEQCDDLDTTAVEALCELQQHLSKRGLRLLLARVKDRPRAALCKTRVQLPMERRWEFFWSVDDAANNALRQAAA